jgi:hypothetical protein
MEQAASIEVRSATLDDVIGIVYVQATTWLSDYVNVANGINEADIRSVDFQAKIRDWQHMVQSSSYQVLVASKKGGEIIGVLSSRRDNHTQIIEHLYVLETYGGSGYEKELLLPALLWLAQGDGPITARVVSYNNRSLEAYANIGFDLFVEGEVDFIKLPSGKSIPTILLVKRTGISNSPVNDVTENNNKAVHKVKPRLVSRSKLARRARMRESTIKYYTEMGLLEFHQPGPRRARRYELSTCLTRLKRIRSLRLEGLSISEIRDQLQ